MHAVLGGRARPRPPLDDVAPPEKMMSVELAEWVAGRKFTPAERAALEAKRAAALRGRRA